MAMTVFFNELNENYLGYSAIFACVGLGFLFLRRVDGREVGPGYWALAFFLNSLGFLFWSGVVPLEPLWYFLLGEVLHEAGFLALVCGAYRFMGNPYKKWNAFVLGGYIALWLGSLLLLRRNVYVAQISLKALRATLYLFAGILIIAKKDEGSVVGRRLAGWSLVGWGLYLLVFAFVRVESLLNLVFGFLVGFQILAAFGLVAMLVDRMRARAEASERRAQRLEGLLPICAYCKRIRDKNNQWHVLESYIEERSSAEFSHGICPDCMKKYHPDQN
jgi:hypothetical protein